MEIPDGKHSDKRCPDCEISLIETKDNKYYCPMCDSLKRLWDNPEDDIWNEG